MRRCRTNIIRNFCLFFFVFSFFYKFMISRYSCIHIYKYLLRFIQTISFRKGENLSANQQMKIEISDPGKLVYVQQFFSWVCGTGTTEFQPHTTLLEKPNMFSKYWQIHFSWMSVCMSTSHKLHLFLVFVIFFSSISLLASDRVQLLLVGTGEGCFVRIGVTI